MTFPLQGLQGLYPDPPQPSQVMDQGVYEAKANPIHPDHSVYGSQNLGYSGIDPVQNPYSGFSIYDSGMMGEEYSGMSHPEFGEEIDRTPNTHSAPWPRGIQQPSWGDPDAYVNVGIQNRAMHGIDQGGPRLLVGNQPGGRETPWTYTSDRYESPDDIVLATAPDQLKSVANLSGNGNTGRGGGGADVVQGYGVNNTMDEFSHGHSVRYVQHDSAVFDYTNTHGEQEVPFWGKHPTQQARFDGPDSPYYEMGDIEGGQLPWEGRISYPSEYVQAPEPTVLPAQTQSADVWAYSDTG